MEIIRHFVNESSFRIAIFVSGILFGTIFPQALDIDFEGKLTLSDIISTISTIFIGIFLATTIANKQTSDRFEKEYLISELSKITSFFGIPTVNYTFLR